jgi:hypothetical protein
VNCRPGLSLCSALLLGTLTARADLIAASRDAPQQLTVSAATFAEPVSEHAGALSALPSQRLFTSLSLGDPIGASTVAVENPEPAQLTTLPPAPNSALLAVSGLLSLGAIQLGRNVRKLHLSALPEWYHDGATQVGHSTPLDLDLGFTHAALPVCAFAQPADPIGPVRFGAQWLDAARCAPQFQPTPECPRAPPKVS